MRSPIALALACTLAICGGASAAAEPSGAVLNRWDCRPSSAHPYPVVLLHGIADSMRSWSALTPRLAATGYCAFALDYGADQVDGIRVNGFAPIERSAAEVAAFIDTVRRRTGATQVDLVGHSEGGAIAELLAKQLEPENRIHAEVLLAPPTHGTSLDGIVGFADRTGLRPATDAVMASAICSACADLEAGSTVIHTLASAPVAVPGVRYSILATREDTVVTPPGAASFIREPGVVNVFVQDLSPGHVVDHGALPRDPVVMDWIMEALGR